VIAKSSLDGAVTCRFVLRTATDLEGMASFDQVDRLFVVWMRYHYWALGESRRCERLLMALP